jgi:nitroreductase
MDVAEAIRTRRAKRAISDRPVEDEKIEALVEASRLSASCNNNQPWRIVIAKGPESLKLVKDGLSRGNAWATRAPVILVVCAKLEDDCHLSDRRDYYLFSAGLSIGQLLLRATELGLIAHPIAGYDPLKIKPALGIPPEYVLITLVLVAYYSGDQSLMSDKQKELEPNRPERKPVGEIYFLDKWGTPFR